MKKTKFMRAALLLLVLTLITSCFVGGTFAKYTTSASGNDSARVAKFGVIVSANSATFKDKYDNDTSATVIGENEAKVVAPGTSGGMPAMTLSGKPEVAVKVTYEGKVELTGWTVTSGFYCPLIIKINGTPVDTSNATDASSFADAINSAIKDYSKDYAAGADLSSAVSPAITWEWPFSTAGNDAKDTELGDAAAKDNAPTITIAVATTVTQID